MKIMHKLLSRRTRLLLKMDGLRMMARLKTMLRTPTVPVSPANLHLGCGKRRVAGWINVDVTGSDYDLDLAGDSLPWSDATFDAVVSQQVIEHLDLQNELLPLLHEIKRVLKPGAEVWLSCPDLGAVCREYEQSKGAGLMADRQTRFPDFSIGDIPSQHNINLWFHQDGQHKNLFDLDLLSWALQRSGFSGPTKVLESDFLKRFPEFPERRDDQYSLYIRARA
jgi:predicted SAM-dependent methyltransferase